MQISTPVTIFRVFGIPITNTNIWTWLIFALILVFFIYLARDLKIRPESKRQTIAEYIVTAVQGLVNSTMGSDKFYFAPYFLSLAAFLLISNLSGFIFIGIVRPPTADLATTLSLALLTFFMTQGFAIKSKGIGGYFKSLAEPVPIMFPMNIISELSNPISLSFRLFGNIVGGLIIVGMIYALMTMNRIVSALIIVTLAVLTILIYMNKIPKFNNKFAKIAIILIFVPALFIAFGHFYFDIFAGVLQTFIFCMLSMVFISGAMD